METYGELAMLLVKAAELVNNEFWTKKSLSKRQGKAQSIISHKQL